MSELLAFIRPGAGPCYLGRYYFNKPGEDFEAFGTVDLAKDWAEGLAVVDDFDLDSFVWTEVDNLGGETLFLTGRRAA
jgi:hypothetical protein